MLNPLEEYISLEMACASIKRGSIELLKTLAQQLSSVLVPSAQFNPITLCVVDKGSPRTDIPVTYEELASYLMAATGKYVPVLFETSTKTVDSHCVLIHKDWLRRQIAAAREKLGIAKTLEAGAANHRLRIATHINGSSGPAIVDQPAPMNEAGYQNLKRWLLHQNDQRRATEAASKDALALQQATQEIVALRAILATNEAQLQQARDGWEQSLREAIEKERERTKLADQLQQYLGIIEFMNPDNPLSPVEGRRLVAAWCELTENGAVDPVAETGIGMEELGRRWWRRCFGEPAGIVVKHLRWALTWPARKKGGMVAKRRPDKG